MEIPLLTDSYRLLEVQGKYDMAFGSSPVLLLSEDMADELRKMDIGETMMVKSTEAGTETEYKIVRYEINRNPTYPQGCLFVFLERISPTMKVLPNGRYKRGEPIRPISPVNDERLQRLDKVLKKLLDQKRKNTE